MDKGSSSSRPSLEHRYSNGEEASDNPQLSYQSHHSYHMPFAIGPLRQDGTTGTSKSSQEGQDQVENSERERSKERRPARERKRDRIARAGRSLSPFRHGHRNSSFTKLSEALSAVSMYRSHDNKLLTPGRSSTHRSDESDTDTGAGESGTDDDVVMSPRNVAFGRGSSDGGRESDGEDFENARQRKGDESPHEPGSRERKHLGERTQDDAEAARGGGGTTDEEADGEQEDEEDSLVDFDDATIDNTLFNAGCLDLHNAWQNNKESIGEGGYYPTDDDPSWLPEGAHGTITEEPDDDGYTDGTRTAPLDATGPITSPNHDPHSRLPNVILPSSHRPAIPQKQGSKWVSSTGSGDEYSLVASRPIFAKNRCTITLVHGQYEKAVKKRESGGGRGPKRWIVASDGSEESSYAIEWTIGTVLRDGDETLIVSVMETSEKLDHSHHLDHPAVKAVHAENQNIRQSMALVLARQATALLQRTRLATKISCQALHAKHARHMLLDLIDFYEPTMVIVGSRGLGSLKGILLGSTSHYILQRSSVPVMIARKRLQLPALPRGKGDVVSSVRRRHMRLDEAAIEKKSNVADEAGEENADSAGENEEDQNGGDAGQEPSEQKEKTPEEVAEKETQSNRQGDQDLSTEEQEAKARSRKEGEAAVAAKEEERRLREPGEGSPRSPRALSATSLGSDMVKPSENKDTSAVRKDENPDDADSEGDSMDDAIEMKTPQRTKQSAKKGDPSATGDKDAKSLEREESRGRGEDLTAAVEEEEQRGRSRSRG